MRQVFAFIDTNTFLHYQAIDHIDWPTLVGADSVVLVIAQIVIRELNKHKDVPSSPKTRERAAAAIKKLHAWSETIPTTTIRDSVELRFRVNDPLLDFGAENLSRDIQDDHLVASILEFRAENPATVIALVTADLGLKLKARAHGIATVQLPDNLRLPEELGAEEKRIRQLEAELRRLRDRIPALKLFFANALDRFEIALPAPEVLGSDALQRQMEEFRIEHPKLRNDAQEPALNILGIDLDAGLSREQIATYNAAVEKFWSDYEQHLGMLHDFKNLQRRIVELEIIAVNEGTCPAEDINIFIHFPNGFVLVDKEHLPKPPSAPKAPRRPKTAREKLEDQFRFPQIAMPDFLRATDLTPRLPEFRNVSHPSIRRTKSYDVEVAISKIKHGYEFVEALDPMYVVFPAFDRTRSFTIDYRIHAANMPDLVEGQMHVIVNRG